MTILLNAWWFIYNTKYKLMRKIVLLVHTSLDGYVANPDHNLDWFEPSDESLALVCELTRSADAALFGRISYRLLDDYWPNAHQKSNATKSEIEFSHWYNNALKIVFSRTIKEGDYPNSSIIAEDIENKILSIKESPGKDILLFGSPSVFQILQELDLVDEYWVFINPVIFGGGLLLFKERKGKVVLQLLKTKTFPNGEHVLNLIVKRN